MDKVTIDQILASISQHLHLSQETETELLAEIRTHLEDAMAEASSNGGDEEMALLKAAEEFGIEEVGAELQEVHAGRESIEAIIVTALPVLFAIILRWLAFSPQGSSLDWPQLLVQPGFWMVAIAALVIPAVFLRRWRFALIGWGFFWLITVIFIVFPSINQW